MSMNVKVASKVKTKGALLSCMRLLPKEDKRYVYVVTNKGKPLCYQCSGKSPASFIGVSVNYHDDHLFCDACSERIMQDLRSLT